MVIAVNTRFLIHDRLEGIGWFSYETLKRISQQHPEHQFHFIFDRPYHPSMIFADNVTAHVIGPQARHPFLWYAWFQWSLPALINKIKPDVFVSPDGYTSTAIKVPNLLVIHDLAFEHFADHHPTLVRKFLQYYSPKYAKNATRIATVSEYSRQDIAQRYGVDPMKIDKVYNGVNNAYKPISAENAQATRNKYTQGQPYFMYAGSINPRKNVVRLLLAFDEYKKTTNAPDKLLLVGAKGWKTGDVHQTLNSLEFKADVIQTGHMGLEQLVPIVASAKCMLYVSLFEGFGIPIVEAMRCGVPVVTSNTSSMPEVAADAALIVDPSHTDSITDAMVKLHNNPELAKELGQKGLERSKAFSWDNAAADLWASIEKVKQQ